MKYIFRFSLLFIMIAAAFSRCYYDSEEYLYPQVSSQCDTTNITFSQSVQPILQNICLSCHSNTTAASFGGNIRLEDYADVKVRVDDHRLIGSIAHEAGYSPMPMGAPMLSDCKITVIKKWAEAGAPNN